MLAQSQAAVEGTLRAQDAELKQLQQGLIDLEAQARRAEAATGEQLELRTETVVDTMTEHYDAVFDEVKTAVEALDWKLQGHANQVWWMGQNFPSTVAEMVAEIEGKLQRPQPRDGSSHGGKKMRVRIPGHTNLETFAGDRSKDKEGSVAWRDRLELQLDTVRPGLAEVFEKIRNAKEPQTELRRTGCSRGSTQMLENMFVVGRANPKNIDQLDQVFKGLYKRMHEYEARVGPLETPELPCRL